MSSPPSRIAPACGIVQPQQQPRERRLAAARAAQHAQDAARGEGESDVVQHRLPVRRSPRLGVVSVAEGDAVELDGERTGRQAAAAPRPARRVRAPAARSPG